LSLFTALFSTLSLHDALPIFGFFKSFVGNKCSFFIDGLWCGCAWTPEEINYNRSVLSFINIHIQLTPLVDGHSVNASVFMVCIGKDQYGRKRLLAILQFEN